MILLWLLRISFFFLPSIVLIISIIMIGLKGDDALDDVNETLDITRLLEDVPSLKNDAKPENE